MGTGHFWLVHYRNIARGTDTMRRTHLDFVQALLNLDLLRVELHNCHASAGGRRRIVFAAPARLLRGSFLLL
jgi:hypothetical protein